ncbi:hypothetical protein KJ766_01655 [Patescibacteria group bacterium]|nr:hypothetical protein [Patescibacteria group bacterium]
MNKFVVVLIVAFFFTGCSGTGGDKFLGEWHLKEEKSGVMCSLGEGVKITKVGGFYNITEFGEIAGKSHDCFGGSGIETVYEKQCLTVANPQIMFLAYIEGDNLILKFMGGQYILTRDRPLVEYNEKKIDMKLFSGEIWGLVAKVVTGNNSTFLLLTLGGESFWAYIPKNNAEIFENNAMVKVSKCSTQIDYFSKDINAKFKEIDSCSEAKKVNKLGYLMIPETGSSDVFYSLGEKNDKIPLNFNIKLSNADVIKTDNPYKLNINADFVIKKDGGKEISKKISLPEVLYVDDFEFYLASYKDMEGQLFVYITDENTKNGKGFAVKPKNENAWEEEQVRFGIIDFKNEPGNSYSFKVWFTDSAETPSEFWMKIGTTSMIERAKKTYSFRLSQHVALGLQVATH